MKDSDGRVHNSGVLDDVDGGYSDGERDRVGGDCYGRMYRRGGDY